VKPDIEEKLHNFNKAVLLIGNYAEKMIEVIKESYAFIEPIIRELEKESDDGRMTESVAESKYKEGCTKCALLLELYERTPQAPRDYWVMTELFDILHGGDVCTGDK
jgi:hypothetical protein